MNEKRRNKLRQVITLLNNAISVAESVRDEEQDSIDNTPENLQGGEAFERKEQAVAGIEMAIDYLNKATEEFDETINC